MKDDYTPLVELNEIHLASTGNILESEVVGNDFKSKDKKISFRIQNYLLELKK